MVVKYVMAACTGVMLAASPARSETAPLAEIMASEPNEAGVNVTVPTGGCTTKADFTVSTHAGKNGVTDVEIRRPKRDACKGNFPAGIKVQFTWGDLKVPAGTKIAVKNPIEARASVLQLRGKAAAQPETATEKKATVAKKAKKKVAKRCLRSKLRKHGCTVKAAKRHVRRGKLHKLRAHHHRHRHHRVHRHDWCF